LLKPNIIKRLQHVLESYPGWEIVYQVSMPGPGDDWPNMCVIIRSREIVDFLQRQYFPPDYQSLHYEGDRPPTEAEFTYYSE
jgi:hypothetical protein